MIRFQTPKDYFKDFTVCLEAGPTKLLLITTNLVLLSKWLSVSIRFIVKVSLFTNSVTL